MLGFSNHSCRTPNSPRAPKSLKKESTSAALMNSTFGSRKATLILFVVELSLLLPDLVYVVHQSDDQRSTLESVAEAAAAGELYPYSGEEEGLYMYSDEEVAGAGLWSGPGTGTEGEVRKDPGVSKCSALALNCCSCNYGVFLRSRTPEKHEKGIHIL